MLKRFISALAAMLMIFSVAVCALPVSADSGVISVDKPYTLKYTSSIENAYPNKAYKPEKKLTDGKKADDDPNNAAWLELYRGTSVEVTVDLGEVMAVDKVSIGQLQKRAWGIYCSRILSLSVSEDGEKFGTVASVKDYQSCTSDVARRIEFTLAPDESYKARYVKVTFSCDVFLLVDEITVYGGKDTSSARSAEPDAAIEDKGFAPTIDGISTIALMYTAANYTAEQILPYVAYVDENGTPKGQKMFDSLLFLYMPVPTNEDGKMRPADMELQLDNLLAPGKNVGALNKVIGDLKEQGIYSADEKYPIFISCPFPEVYVGCSDLASREKVVKNYIDSAVKKFNAAGYDNLELKGIYWFEELIRYSLTDHEEDLIKYFNDYCHSIGYKTIWIPYFCAAGIDKAVELGFDSAVMQSGYAFEGGDETGVAKLGTCSDAAAAAKKFGLGLEFEVDSGKPKYYEKFADYVHVAYAEGLMGNGMMMMYQSGLSLYYSALGAAKVDRKLYDLTYQYCSGEYAEYPPVVEGDVEITVKAESYGTKKFKVTDQDTPLNKLKTKVLERPENGPYVLIEGDGFVSVEAYGVKPGVYVYKAVVTDGAAESEPFTVTVTIEGDGTADENNSASESGSSSESDGKSGKDKNKDKNEGERPFIRKYLVYIIIGAVLAVAVVAVLVVVLIKKRKKNK